MKANPLREGLSRHFTPAQLQTLANATVGIAGAGGLGSNIAMALARSGIGHLVIIDRDILEPSNLNRQHYWPSQLGEKKVEALASHLHALDWELDLEIIHGELTRDNVESQVQKAQLWVEALDDPHAKKLLVDTALSLGYPVIAASGIAGYGGCPIGKRKIGQLILIGDLKTSTDAMSPLAPRVMQAAGLMADAVLELLLPQTPPASLPPGD